MYHQLNLSEATSPVKEKWLWVSSIRRNEQAKLNSYPCNSEWHGRLSPSQMLSTTEPPFSLFFVNAILRGPTIEIPRRIEKQNNITQNKSTKSTRKCNASTWAGGSFPPANYCINHESMTCDIKNFFIVINHSQIQLTMEWFVGCINI